MATIESDVFRKLAIAAWIACGFTLQAQDKLTIDRLELHQYEDGPVLPGSYEFLPGETIWFSCRVGGFRVESKGEERHVKLNWALRVEDPSGVLVEKPRSGEIADRLSRKTRSGGRSSWSTSRFLRLRSAACIRFQ